MHGATVKFSSVGNDAAAAALRFQRLSRCSALDSVRKSRFTTPGQILQPCHLLHNLSLKREILVHRQDYDRNGRRRQSTSAWTRIRSSHQVRPVSITSKTSTPSPPSQSSQTEKPISPRRVAPIKQRPAASSRRIPSIPSQSPIVIASPDSVRGTTEVPIVTLANSKFRLPEPLYLPINPQSSYRALWYKFSPDPSLYAKVVSYFHTLLKEVDQVDARKYGTLEDIATTPSNSTRAHANTKIQPRQVHVRSHQPAPDVSYLFQSQLRQTRRFFQSWRQYIKKDLISVVLVLAVLILPAFLFPDITTKGTRPTAPSNVKRPDIHSDINNDEPDVTPVQNSQHNITSIDTATTGLPNQVENSSPITPVPPVIQATEVTRTTQVEQLSDVLSLPPGSLDEQPLTAHAEDQADESPSQSLERQDRPQQPHERESQSAPGPRSWWAFWK